jgi:hypothetical protein
MRRWSAYLTLGMGILLAACQSPAVRTKAATDIEDMDEMSSQEFREEYARFIVEMAPSSIKVETRKLASRTSLMKAGGLRLELLLGDRWSQKGPDQYEYLRTESRYRVLDGAGRLLASGESVISTADLGEEGIPEYIRVFWDATSGGFLVEEEHNWSTGRCLALFPDAASGKWTVKHFQLPRPKRILPGGSRPECVGFQEGKVYFTFEGVTLAVPIESLPETGLGFSIG